MDIKVLRNFVRIIECGSLTAAAKKIFIAQPALSNQLKALEKEVGSTLIERNSRSMKLTDTGKLFYERALRIIMLEDSMLDEIHDCDDGLSGALRIASIQSAEMTMLEKIIPDFVKEYPNIRYELFEERSDSILRLLSDGTVDIGIVRTPCNITDEMETVFISDEELVVIYNKEAFSFSSDTEYITVSELQNKPLLVISRYKEMVEKFLLENSFKPAFRCVNSLLTTNIKWAEEGLGLAIAPMSSISTKNTALGFKRFEGAPLTTRRAIVTMKNKYRTKAVDTFIKICEKTL